MFNSENGKLLEFQGFPDFFLNKTLRLEVYFDLKMFYHMIMSFYRQNMVANNTKGEI